jgi:hypothetical protein
VIARRKRGSFHSDTRAGPSDASVMFGLSLLRPTRDH